MKDKIKYHDHFFKYIEGQMTRKEKIAFEKDLDKKTETNALFKKFETFMETIQEEKELEPDKDLTNQIMNKIKTKNNQKSHYLAEAGKKVLKPLLATAAIISGIYFGINLGNDYYYSTTGDISEQTKEYFINDFNNESIEAFLLNE